jgi:hypothetical protein
MAISLASLALACFNGRRRVGDRPEFPSAPKQSSIEGWLHN